MAFVLAITSNFIRQSTVVSHYTTLHVPGSHTMVRKFDIAGGEDDAAQLLSNEHALARNNMGMVPEHGTPLAQQNINVGRPPSTSTYPQVCLLPPIVMMQKKRFILT